MSFPKHVVIVEDEVITQRFLQDVFAQCDVEVTACYSNAVDTLKGLKGVVCDMLLMDINILGPTDGIQLAKKILEVYNIPIVFITAHNDDETLEEILELAPYGFIAKPFSAKDVMINIQIAYKRYLTHLEVCNVSKEVLINDVIINETYIYSKRLKKLFAGSESIKLNQKQSILMEILVEYINQTVSYDILISRLWGQNKIADSALRTLVYSLRKLLPDLPIVSYSKVGYMLEKVEEEKND